MTAGRFTSAVLALTGAALASLAGQTRDRAPAPAAAPRVVAIAHATILTGTHGTIPNGTIVLRDGRIAAVGADVPVPAGADVVDATGRFVSPGIVDCHSHIGIDSVNEGGTTVSSMTGTEDVINPTDVDIYRDLAGGVTTANVLHGSANPIGGKNVVIKLRWGTPRAADLVFAGAMPGIKFALGENTKQTRLGGQGGVRRYPITRMGVEYVIRDAFTRAQAYQRSWQEYERRRSAGEDLVPPRRDLQLEPLVEVLEGKRLVHAHSYRADEILMLLRLAEEFKFKIATFQHVLEGYKVASEIAAHGAGASTFSDWWGYKVEAVDAIPYNAALMTRKGVVVSVNSDSAEHARRLNTEAAKSMHWGGLSEDEALALVTINPAKQLRIDNRVGSLEAGKDADVVIWNHHPLSSYAIADRVYIDGRLYYDRATEDKRLTELRSEKASLVAAEGGARGAPPSTSQAEPKPHAIAGDVRGGPSDDGDGDGNAAVAPARTSQPAAGARSPAAPHTAASTAPTGIIAIVNARIVPVTHPVIERGAIIVRNGRIEALGASVQAPPGATIIDAAGQEVYPGWISARSTIGLADPGPAGYADTNEMLEFNPQLRPVVAYHNDSDAIPVARANGVTTVGVMPGGGVLGGQTAVMNLDGWTYEESTVTASAGVTFQFPSIGGGGRGGGGRASGPPRPYEELKKERDAKLDDLARLLDNARAYAKAAGANRQVDWMLDALVPIVEGRQPFFVRTDKESDIRDAVAFADRVKVKIVIVGGLEAPLVAGLLKDHGIPVILGPVLTLPTREDDSHASTYQAAGELVRAGVKIAFTAGGVGDAANVRQLPYNAAESVAWGLPRDEAVKALTINAAEILGVAGEIGSLEPGKMANLLIAKGDPLEVRTEVTHVIINGRDVSLMNKQLALYERYSKRP